VSTRDLNDIICLVLAGAVGLGAAHGIYATGCGNHDVVEELWPGASEGVMY